jgi:hypothetical protein
MGEPNLMLAAAIEDAGLSHSGLAARINTANEGLRLRYDHASVARWIRDGAIPRPPAPDLICVILGARLGRTLLPRDIGMASAGATSATTLSHVVDQAKALWRADQRASPDGRIRSLLTGPSAVAPLFEWENPPPDLDVSRAGAPGPVRARRVGSHDVSAVMAARTHFEQMYRSVGGVPVRPRIVAYLTNTIAPMLDSTYDDVTGRTLFRAVGGLVAFMGVCTYDAEPNRQSNAQRYFFHALRMAKASGDRAFGAYVVALLTNQAIFLEDHRLAIQYAETALRAGRGAISPGLSTDLHAMQAKAYARIGDRASCLRQMQLAETAAARIDVTAEPPETSYVQPGLVAVQHSEALRRVGDLRTAQTYAEEAVRAHTHARGQVHRLVTLATVLTTRREVDHAANVATRALDLASGMESWRIRDRLTALTTALAAYRGAPGVTDVLERAQHVLAVTSL